MNGTASPPHDQPPPPPPPPPPEEHPPAATGTPRVIGGVCAVLADGLGVDPVWVRIGFVLLTLTGGLGLVLYAALWLLLIVAPTSSSALAALAGGAILVFGLPLVLGGFSLDRPLTMLILLIGLTLALWQPRTEPNRTPPRPGLRLDHRGDEGTSDDSSSAAAPSQRSGALWFQRHSAPRLRDPSPLGPLTMGAAMAVAAVGALIDQANGGRLHPEQWLGAAAIVCGIGLLVGTVRGHARWLIVPALVLAGAGALAGEMARLDIGTSDWAGDRWIGVWADSSGPITARTGLGQIRISVDERPETPLMIDARVAVGRISIDAETSAAVDVHRNDGAPERIGRADGPADVIVDARTGTFAEIDLGWWTNDSATDPNLVDGGPLPGRPEGLGELTWISDGVTMTNDGWFLLADGEAVIDDQNGVVVGDPTDEDLNVLRFHTNHGEFALLPRGLLMTPYGEVLDLEAIRADLVEVPAPPITEPPLPNGDPPSTTALADLQGAQP